MNVRSVTVFKKRMKQRRLATGYKANVEGDSVKAYYGVYDQNRELILASKQAQYQAVPKEKKSYEVGVYRLGAICPSLFTREGTVILSSMRVFLRVVCELQCYLHPPPLM